MKHTKTSSKLALLLLCLSLLLSLSACGETAVTQEEISSMDTIMTLTAYGSKRDAGISAAKAVIYSMNDMLDPDLSTSTVYAINHANGAPVVVSGQIAKMVSTAQTVYEKSGGALDLTIYPLVQRWGFIDQRYYVPTDEEISAEMAKFCFDKLVLTNFAASGTYTVEIPAYGSLSFGAIAKGAASDYAIEAMRNAGVESGVISLGGNVQTLGLKPDGTKWNVAIQDPNYTASYLGVISVGETAVVTSGQYQRNFTSGGKTYGHIIRPSSGYPASNTLLSVTIVCEDGTMADALSTAMFVLGENGALSYWRANKGFDMILVTKEKQVICTSGLMEQFTLTNTDYTLKYTE